MEWQRQEDRVASERSQRYEVERQLGEEKEKFRKKDIQCKRVTQFGTETSIDLALMESHQREQEAVELACLPQRISGGAHPSWMGGMVAASPDSNFSAGRRCLPR